LSAFTRKRILVRTDSQPGRRSRIRTNCVTIQKRSGTFCGLDHSREQCDQNRSHGTDNKSGTVPGSSQHWRGGVVKTCQSNRPLILLETSSSKTSRAVSTRAGYKLDFLRNQTATCISAMPKPSVSILV